MPVLSLRCEWQHVDCYAERVAARFSGPGLAFESLARRAADGEARWTGEMRLVAEKLDEPLRWRRPRRIFVNSMSDLFHEGLTNEQIAAVFGVMAAAPWHTFQVLTKRAARLPEWFAWLRRGDRRESIEVRSCTLAAAKILREPLGKYAGRGARGEITWPLPNVWLGVSAENQETADERIPHLLYTPATVHFVSYEPALDPIRFGGEANGGTWDYLKGIDQGLLRTGRRAARRSSTGSSPALSRVRARPFDLEWFRSVRDQCVAAGAAFYLKRTATPSARKIVTPELDERRWQEYPAGGVSR